MDYEAKFRVKPEVTCSRIYMYVSTMADEYVDFVISGMGQPQDRIALYPNRKFLDEVHCMKFKTRWKKTILTLQALSTSKSQITIIT